MLKNCRVTVQKVAVESGTLYPHVGCAAKHKESWKTALYFLLNLANPDGRKQSREELGNVFFSRTTIVVILVPKIK